MASMARSTLFFIILLAFFAALMGYNYYAKPVQKWQDQRAEEYRLALQASPSPSPQTGTPAEQARQQVISQLTPQQKVAQIIAVPVRLPLAGPFSSTASAQTNRWLETTKPGFIVIFGRNIGYEEAQVSISQLKTAAQLSEPNIPTLALVDHEGGTVVRLSGTGFTKLPSWQELCTLPPETTSELLRKSARELSLVGINMVLAPVVDVGANSAVFRSRLCSSQPELVVDRATLAIDAYQAFNVKPVLKHFPGIGETTRDLHTSFDRVTVTPELALIYAQLLQAFPRVGVMISHAGVVNQFADVPCSLSQTCVGELTSNANGALVMSDALEMVSAGYQKETQVLKPLSQVAEEAVLAGNHILLFGGNASEAEIETVVATLSARYQRDAAFKAKLDQALWRVLEEKKVGEGAV